MQEVIGSIPFTSTNLFGDRWEKLRGFVRLVGPMKYELSWIFCRKAQRKNVTKLTLEQRHKRRNQAVRLHKKALDVMQIVSMAGLGSPAVRSCQRPAPLNL